MTRPESQTGGLKGQLQSLALSASVDEHWKQPVVQAVSLERTAYLPDSVNVALTTQFEAHRKRLTNVGGSVLRTFYTVCATEVQTDMIFEELPPSVQKNFVSLTSAPMEAAEPLSSFREGENAFDTEQLIDEEMDYDEDLFRFEKTVKYYLNGNAQVLGIDRGAHYFHMNEDGEDEIFDDEEYEAGDPNKSRELEHSLALWPSTDIRKNRLEEPGFSHPDLKDIEYQVDRKSLEEDIQFLELVQGYSQDSELNEHTRRERIQAIMSILAFTTLNGSADEVRKYI